MPKYVAFLRAINVGSHTVKMDTLRRLFAQMGFSNVETFIASGNVIFDSTSRSASNLERKIEKCLHEALGYEVTTFIRSTAELALVASYKPFPDAELNGAGNVLYVAFVGDVPGDAAKRKMLALTTPIDDFHIEGRELYWLRRMNLGQSVYTGSTFEKTLGMKATVRNSNTVRKIALKYP